MSDREFEFDEGAMCDGCGKIGSTDIYGNYLCWECMKKDIESFQEDRDKWCREKMPTEEEMFCDEPPPPDFEVFSEEEGNRETLRHLQKAIWFIINNRESKFTTTITIRKY